ncbi:MAG: indolepyruvate ferredoxin oxidoreductase subunit alpha [Chloroflexi bacterium]|nr:indolepyruvate ferredoxin oxidoreductase subunit alpha [Chloroflexota bacterium]
MKRLLSGNEAIAWGAWEAGVRVASAYPGTPSTEILETLAPMPGVYAEWAPNEKVALDVAIGASYAGSRAMAVMKHVGLNVAADALFYASMTGSEAGLVIVSADDPFMHSSQNEQDNRHYAKFARVPCIEPSDSQEAKDLVAAAFEISERFDTPVLLRITTRLAHSSAPVEIKGERQDRWAGPPYYRIDTAKYVMVPGNARRRHHVIEQRIARLTEFAETFPYNRVEMGDTALGIVTNGVGYQYTREVFPTASILRLGMTYPIPSQLVRDFASRVKRLIVVEELDPFLEESIRLLGIPVEGKSIFPICGEFSPEVVRDSAIKAGLLPESTRIPTAMPDKGPLPGRPPILCPGCPHRGVFVVTSKLKLVVNGDIGCYTLGFLPPQAALHTCGCMGASIGQAHGVAKAGIQQRHVAVLGDSTFFHTGMPALLNVAYNQSNTITIILDNRTTAMTGHQENPATGITLQKQKTVAIEFEPLVRSMGIQRVHVVDSYNLKQVESALRDCLDSNEPAVIIARRECALLPEARKQWIPLQVDPEICNGCGLCFKVGCPAILQSGEVDEKTGRAKAQIDRLLCTGCEICAQVCARKAILFRHQVVESSGKS